jgi:hypothetical protein
MEDNKTDKELVEEEVNKLLDVINAMLDEAAENNRRLRKVSVEIDGENSVSIHGITEEIE